MFLDSHAHLQWSSFDKDRGRAIDRARKAGVKYIVNIGSDVATSRRAIELAQQYSGLYATVGVHPHNASAFSGETLKELKKLSENPKVVAIGEIGLDFFRNLSPREAQKRAFESQLLLAQELALPVVIHDREAHAETQQILSKFKGTIIGILHCFSGSIEMAERSIESNFFISLAGPVTFPHASKLHRIAKQIDSDKILLETDSPWLSPQRMRGKRNEPSFLPFIAEKVAQLKGISVEEIARATTKNAKEIFALE